MSADTGTRELFAARLTDADGNEVVLGERVSGQTCLLVFMRHFGCIGCTAQISDLVPRLPELDALSVKVILIGNGNADFVAEFIRRHGLVGRSVEVLVDPDLGSYSAAGMRRSVWGTIGLGALVRQLRLAGRGMAGYRGSGSDFQQGGVLLVDKGGQVVRRFVSKGLGDQADLNPFIDAALAVQADELGVAI